jgi:hypothetical protein
MAVAVKSAVAPSKRFSAMRRVRALGLSATLLLAVSGTGQLSASAAPSTVGAHLVALKTPPAGPYLAVLKNDESDIASHIGHPLGVPVSVVVNSKQVDPTALAYTYAYDSKGDLTGRPASCVIG